MYDFVTEVMFTFLINTMAKRKTATMLFYMKTSLCSHDCYDRRRKIINSFIDENIVAIRSK